VYGKTQLILVSDLCKRVVLVSIREVFLTIYRYLNSHVW